MAIVDKERLSIPSLKAVSDERLLEVFNNWDGFSAVDVPGTCDGEDVYMELLYRGIAPPI